MYMSNFGIALALLVLGIGVSLLLRKKKNFRVVWFSAFMLLIGLANYVGISRHAWRTRDLWPLYLALFLGVGLYFLVSRVYKKWSLGLSYGLSFILVLMFSGILVIPSVPHVESFTSPGIMTGGHWDSLLWLRENVADEEKILFVYGDLYDQNALLRNTFKPPYHVHSREYTAALQNRTVKRNIRIMLLGDRAGVHYAYRKSFFDYGYYYREFGKDYFYKTERDMCDFDYYVMDKVSRQPALAQYNMLIANLLVNNTFIGPVFDNGVVLVLKNDGVGEDCLENETKF